MIEDESGFLVKNLSWVWRGHSGFSLPLLHFTITSCIVVALSSLVCGPLASPSPPSIRCFIFGFTPALFHLHLSIQHLSSDKSSLHVLPTSLLRYHIFASCLSSYLYYPVFSTLVLSSPLDSRPSSPKLLRV